MTIARWLTPNKRQITKIGLEPDFPVEITDEDLAAGNDVQLQKAIDVLLNNLTPLLHRSPRPRPWKHWSLRRIGIYFSNPTRLEEWLPMIFDTRYLIFMLPAFIIMMVVQWYVQSAYRRWSKVPTRSRLTGAEAAQRLISSGGLYDVRIEGVAGNLTDHYDPRKKTLRLSQGVFASNSVAASGDCCA